jgi:hypothetical protein
MQLAEHLSFQSLLQARAGQTLGAAAYACGYGAIFGSEQRITALYKHTTCKEITGRDRLPHHQPDHLQKKEEINREANNFCLKSCPAHWVYLRVLQFLISFPIFLTS